MYNITCYRCTIWWLTIFKDYIWAFLVAQMVKTLPTMWEIQFRPWVRKIPGRKEWQPTPIFLPGESHGQRSLVGYSPWGCKESDMTERLIHTHTHTHSYSIYSYYKILHIFSMWYNIPLWFIHFVHNSLHLLGSDPSISPPPYPLPIGNP